MLFRFLFIIAAFGLHAETFSTFYGSIEVEEPVLIDLIRSPAFQRLKFIHQYGVQYYTSIYFEEYNRFDHSMGVFAILRAKGASLEEQIAGLLHDVSHTAFSHVGDWVFAKENLEEDYQNHIHNQHLAQSGIEAILNRHGYVVEEISPKREEFKMLEQPLPNLCADRIDYNIQGAYFRQFITREEALEIFSDISFEGGGWVLSNRDLALKLAHFSLFMSENCWGSAFNFITSRWLADAIIRGVHAGLISWHEFHFGTDQNIWDRLSASNDSFIQNRMEKLAHPTDYFRLVPLSEASILIPFKCRGVDPLIRQDGNIVSLSSVDPEFKAAFQKTKKQSLDGWPVEFLRSALQ